MVSVSLHEAKTHLSSLVSVIERNGEKIIICKHGRAVAEIGPVSSGSRLKTDKELKKVRILGDVMEPTTGEWENV
jgi:antitoxin (DNA-binding transcriptional repressor) of toxin-antitoxin stability system